MSQGDKFYQHGYDHYLKAPNKKPTQSAGDASHFGSVTSVILRRMRSPAVAAVALLATGAIFAGVIVATYPSSNDAPENIPIVKADLRPIKTLPIEPGGMDIPHRESSILARVGQPSVQGEPEEIENLLATTDEELISKERVLEQAMGYSPMMPDEGGLDTAERAPATFTSIPESEAGSDIEDLFAEENVYVPDAPQEVEVSEVNLEEPKAPDLLNEVPLVTSLSESPNAGDILQKIGSSEAVDETQDVSEFERLVASAVAKEKPVPPERMHAAATSPETLEFVRSVLDAAPSKLNDIETSSGASSVPAAPVQQVVNAAPIASGNYFVQLASITDSARANGEWTKMKAQYAVLSSSAFRVQEAAVNGGTFYRIQAGPMSKASAEAVCDALKNAGKPGGCLVVK